MSSTSQQRFGDNMQAIDLLARIVAFTDPFAAPDIDFQQLSKKQESGRKVTVLMMTSLLRAFKGGHPCLSDVNPTSTSKGYFYANIRLAEHATYQAVRASFGYSATRTFEEVIVAVTSVLGQSDGQEASGQEAEKVHRFLIAWRQAARKMMLDQLDQIPEDVILSNLLSQPVTA